jgi:hypothetical protein
MEGNPHHHKNWTKTMKLLKEVSPQLLSEEWSQQSIKDPSEKVPKQYLWYSQKKLQLAIKTEV